MESLRRLVLVGTILLVGSLGWSQISGSSHDFTSKSWNTTGQVCIVCHAPHNAGSGAAPLWNHASTAATFTLYSSPTFNATAAQPSGASKACLSCHDGTVAPDSFGGKTGTSTLVSTAVLGTDLSNDHPVSFTYDTALATTDKGLKDPATSQSGLGSTINANMLFAGKLECSSCHDVHNSGGNAAGHLLVKSNSGSALCLTCHSK